MRDSRKKGAGLRDQAPPNPFLERTVFMIVRYTSYNSTLLLLVNNMGTYSLNPRKRYCGVTIQPLWEKFCIVDSWIYFIRILTLKFAKFFKNILGNPRLRFWKGCNFVCSKTACKYHTIMFSTYSILWTAKLANKAQKPALTILDTPIYSKAEMS